MSEAPGPDLGRTGPATGRRSSRDGPAGATPAASSASGPGPGRTSATVALVVAALATLCVGVAGGFGIAAALSVAGGTALAWAVSLVTSDDPLRVGLGAATGTVATVEVAVAGVVGGPAAWALWVGVFGVGLVRFRPSGGRVVDGVSVLGYGLVPLWVAAVLAVLARPAVTALVTLVTSTGDGEAFVLTTLVLLAAVGAASVRAALGVLPLRVLAADRTARPAVERVRRWLLWVAALAAVGVPVAAVLEGAGVTVAAGLATSVARLSLAAVAAGGCAVTVAVLAVRWAGGSMLSRTGSGVAAGVGVVFSAVVVAARVPVVSRTLSVASPPVTAAVVELRSFAGASAAALLVVAVGLVAVVVTLFSLPALVGSGVVPRRAAAPTLGVVGLLAGVVFAADGLPAPVVVGGVASAMVVWDLGEFAVGVGEEVPDGAPRTEAVHAAGSLAVGAAVTALVAGGHAAVASVEPGGASAVAALVAALVGALALSTLLRG